MGNPSRDVADIDLSLLAKQKSNYNKRRILVERRRILAANSSIAFGYARYSGEGQHESSIERQSAGITGYATSQEMDYQQLFADRAKTGLTADRNGLNECLTECEKFPGCNLIVEKVDRFIRSLAAYDEIIARLRRADITVHDLGGPKDDLTLPIHAYLATEDGRRIQHRMTKGRIEFFKNGGWIGPAPLGYRLVNKKLEIDEEKAAIVRTIFQMRYNRAEINEIIHFLEVDLRLPTPNGGTAWHASTLRRLLQSPIYVGVACYDIEEEDVR